MLRNRGRIAVVDLTARRVDTSEIPESVFRSFIGGRGLGGAILLRHGGNSDALAPESPLCVLVGPMTGTDFPLANRLTFVFRSPQTGTVAWANTGGYIAAELRNGGLDGIVVLGRAEGPVYLHVAGAEVTIRSARALWGKGALATTEALQAAHPNARVLAIGPAGEALVPTPRHQRQDGRAAAQRGGRGLGCQGAEGDRRGRPAARSRPSLTRAPIRTGPQRAGQDPRLDGARFPRPVRWRCTAPPLHSRRSARTRRCPRATIPHDPPPLPRDGRARPDARRCGGPLTCTRCPIRCRRLTASQGRFHFHVEGPTTPSSAPRAEADLVDLEAIAYMNYLCYDLGFDPIEMGNTLAMLAEATDRGMVRDGVAWGDAARFEALIRQAGRRRASGPGSVSAPPARLPNSASMLSPCRSRASRSRTSIPGRSRRGACSMRPKALARPLTSGPTATSSTPCGT